MQLVLTEYKTIYYWNTHREKEKFCERVRHKDLARCVLLAHYTNIVFESGQRNCDLLKKKVYMCLRLSTLYGTSEQKIKLEPAGLDIPVDSGYSAGSRKYSDYTLLIEI